MSCLIVPTSYTTSGLTPTFGLKNGVSIVLISCKTGATYFDVLRFTIPAVESSLYGLPTLTHNSISILPPPEH